MFLRRRGNDGGLPMAMNAPYGGSGGGSIDGSGKSIHMDAPIVRSWKKASSYTRGTYISLVFSLVTLYWGYRYIRLGNASIWLDCHAKACTLSISPPGLQGTHKFYFSRKQIVKSQAVKVDKHGNFIRVDTGPLTYKKGRGQMYLGPDNDGNYDSYTLVLRDPQQQQQQHQQEEEDEERLDELQPLDGLDRFATREQISNHYVVMMRQYNMGQTRRRARTLSNKVDSYIKQRRHKLLIKENATMRWQGIMGLVVGLFSLLLTLLVGQFYDPAPPSMGGPGSRQEQQRRKRQQQQQRRNQPSQRRGRQAAQTYHSRKGY